MIINHTFSLLHVTTSHSVLPPIQLLVLIILILRSKKCAKRPDDICELPSRTFATAAIRCQTPPRLETLNINRWAGGPWAVRARAPAGQHGDRVMLLPGSSDAALILRFCACFLGIFKISRQEKYFNKKTIGNKPFLL